MERFAFATVVWGMGFVEAFLDVCLASLLTPGNLPLCAQRMPCRYRIYTTGRDAHAVRRSESYRRLTSIMPVELALISGVAWIGKYQAMTQCHGDFIRSVAGEDCAFFIVSPDVVWADGAFARLLEISKLGKRMAVMSTPRLAKETFVPSLLQRYRRDGVLAGIPPRELVALALRHLHPVTLAQLSDPGRHPGAELGDFVWPVGGEGLLVRQFHMQPLMVRPADRNAVPHVAFDFDYSLKACPDPDDAYVIEDSDELCVFDFTGGSSGNSSARREPRTIEEIVSWARSNTHVVHQAFVRHKIRFHRRDCSEQWNEVERRSDLTLDPVLARLVDTPSSGVPTRPTARRYLSPAYLVAKFRQKGARAFVRQACRTLARGGARQIYGPSIKIRIAAPGRIG